MGLLSRIKRWFTGGGSKTSSTTSRASRVSNYGGGGSRSYRDYSDGGYSSDYQSYYNRRELERKERKQKQERTTNAFASISNRTDALSSGNSISNYADSKKSNLDKAVSQKRTGNGTTRALAKIAEKTAADIKATPPEAKPKQNQGRKTISDNRAALNKATNNKYNTEAGTKEERLRARQRIKSGELNADPEAARVSFEQHPIANLAGRKVAQGMSFGLSDLAERKLGGDRYAEERRLYEQAEKEHPWIAGGAEMAGALVSFGGTAGMAEKAGAKLTSKVAPKAAEKLAAKKIIQKSAQRSVNKAVKKGLVGEASEELVKRVGEAKAKKIMTALGTDVVQNWTTGLVYDVATASKYHEVGSADWWKELGKSAAFNRIATGAIAGGSMLTGGKKLAAEAAEQLGRASSAKRTLRGSLKVKGKAKALRPGAEEAVENAVERNADDVARAASDLPEEYRIPKSQEYVRELEEKGETWLGQHGHITANEDGTYNLFRNGIGDETLSKEEATSYINRARDALETEMRNSYESTRVTRTTPLNEAENARVSEIDNEVERLRSEGAEDAKQLKDNKYKDTEGYWERQGERARREHELQNEKDNIVRKEPPTKAEQQKAEPPTVNAEPAKVEPPTARTEPPTARVEEPEIPAARAAVENADEATERAVNEAVEADAARAEIRGSHEKLHEDILNSSGGKYGARKSYVTAADFADDAEVARLAKENRRVMDELSKGDGLGDVLPSDRTYLRNNREVRDRIAREQAIKALNDPGATIEKLRSKLATGDNFTLEDYAQMTAIKNYCKQQGIELPADVASDFSRIYMTSQTDRAQLLRSSYLFMAENDPNFKEHLLRKDLARFRERVCHVSEEEWSKMSAELDKAKGENGWLEKEISRLSGLTGAENRQAFEKEYRDLCKEIYRYTEPSFWEVISLIRHSFMLSNIKTGANNILGNVSQLSMYRMSDMLHVAFENQVAKSAARNGKEFTRTTAFLKNNELKKLARWGSLQSGALGESISKGAKETEFEKLFNGEVKKRVSQAMGDSKYGFDWEKGSAIKYEGAGKLKGAVIKGAQKYSKAVGFMLNEPDSWFVEKSYRLAFAKYLEANGITTAKQFAENEPLIRKASDYAFDVALENTYKKANRVVTFLEGARAKGYAKNSKVWQKAISIGLDAEVPYLKVPTNLVINNFKYSPMGLVKGGVNAMSALKHGDVEALNKSCTELAKGLTGTGMAMLGFFLACDDQAGDDDWGFISSAKEDLKEYGVRDNSFKIGDKNLNLANMGIGAVQFLMGARYAEEINARGGAPSDFLDDFETLTSVFGANFDAIADMSLLDNTFAIFDAVSNKGDYDMKRSEQIGNLGLTIAGNYAGQFIPAPMRSIARGITDADLDTNIKKGEGDKATRQIRRSANNIISGVPVVNEKVLPYKVDRHGNLVNERTTPGAKAKQTLINIADPFNTKTVKIPEADKVELAVKDENGKGYQPKGFDENRKYQAKIGQGSHAEKLDLTGKEREQVARSFKHSGGDMAYNLVYSKAAWFGDSHGERAQQIMQEIPDDEEKAREYLYNTPEFKALDDEQKTKFMDALYDSRLGRGRTANYEAYVNIKGGDEGDFRFQNDLHWKQQDKYEDLGLAEYGITKGQWADVIAAAKEESHKFKDGQNVDTINSAYKLKKALIGLDLTPEQRVAAYQAIRGKRNGFGWYDWNGTSLKSGYSKRRRRGYSRRGYSKGSSKKAELPKAKAMKASQFVKGEALVSKRSSSSSKKAEPPKLKRVQAKIDLPNKKGRKER